MEKNSDSVARQSLSPLLPAQQVLQCFFGIDPKLKRVREA